jgi:hypothetical protein
MIGIILSIVAGIIITLCTILICILNIFKKEIWDSIEFKEKEK